MSPQRSVVLDPELGKHARGEPIRIALTGYGKLDNPPRDQFCFLVAGTGRKVKFRAGSVERLAHGFNMLWLESKSAARLSGHRGATEVCSGASPARGCATTCTVKAGTPGVFGGANALASSVYNENAAGKYNFRTLRRGMHHRLQAS
jgi:hypothetical protein